MRESRGGGTGYRRLFTLGSMKFEVRIDIDIKDFWRPNRWKTPSKLLQRTPIRSSDNMFQLTFWRFDHRIGVVIASGDE